jgi:hypothetical protein
MLSEKDMHLRPGPRRSTMKRNPRHAATIAEVQNIVAERSMQ